MGAGGSWRPGLSLCVVALALASTPGAASATTTFGSSLAGEPGGETCAAVTECISTEQVTDQIPVYGVIVRWRIKTDNAEPVEARLRVLGASNGVGRTGETEMVPAGPRVSEFFSRLPVIAVSSFGLDGGGRVLAAKDSSLSTVWRGFEGMPPDEHEFPAEPHEDTELLLSVDVEPDADDDGYGDETQDACPNDEDRHEVGSCHVSCAFAAGSRALSQSCGRPCCVRPPIRRCRRAKVWRVIEGERRCVWRQHRHHRSPHLERAKIVPQSTL